MAGEMAAAVFAAAVLAGAAILGSTEYSFLREGERVYKFHLLQNLARSMALPLKTA